MSGRSWGFRSEHIRHVVSSRATISPAQSRTWACQGFRLSCVALISHLSGHLEPRDSFCRLRQFKTSQTRTTRHRRTPAYCISGHRSAVIWQMDSICQLSLPRSLASLNLTDISYKPREPGTNLIPSRDAASTRHKWEISWTTCRLSLSLSLFADVSIVVGIRMSIG
jgi:hypothetical protein